MRTLFVLPVGGVMALAPTANGEPPVTRWVTIAAPCANFVAAALLAGAAYAIDPRAHLLTEPWITQAYVLRSMIWLQVLMGALNLLPSASVPSPAALRGRVANLRAGKPVFGLGTAIALGMLAIAAITANVWLALAAGFILLGSQLSTPASAANVPGDDLLVRDVMLKEFSVLGTSDTLGGAISSTVHSLQDIFPVARGNMLVGSVARGALVNQLRTEGDGYLQGLMTRTLDVVRPDEKLVAALKRASGLGAGEFIPVADGDRVVGILSPQNLARAVQQIKLSAAVAEASARPGNL